MFVELSFKRGGKGETSKRGPEECCRQCTVYTTSVHGRVTCAALVVVSVKRIRENGGVKKGDTSRGAQPTLPLRVARTESKVATLTHHKDGVLALALLVESEGEPSAGVEILNNLPYSW